MIWFQLIDLLVTSDKEKAPVFFSSDFTKEKEYNKQDSTVIDAAQKPVLKKDLKNLMWINHQDQVPGLHPRVL